MAAARQTERVGLHKAHPVGHVEGQIQSLDVAFKLVLRVLGNEHRQAAAGVQVIRLPTDQHRLRHRPARFGGPVGVKPGIGVQHGAQVHHVPAAVIKGAEGVHPAAPAANLRGVSLLQLVHQHRAHVLHGALQRVDLSQVDGAQGQVIVRGLLQPGLHVGVDNPLAQLLRGHVGILPKGLQPGRIVPAGTRLQFLAGHIAVDVVAGQHRSHLVSGHHAGVTAEQVDVEAAQRLVKVVERIVDLRQRQPVLVFRRIVKAHARLGARAVVPQDHRRLPGGIFGEPVFQELPQALLAAHGSPPPVRDGFKVSVAERNEVPRIPFDLLKVPFRSAARQDDNVHIVPVFGDAHFVDVLAGGVLQIGAAHIDQQRQIGLCGRADSQQHKSRQYDAKHNSLHLISPNSAARVRASARVVTPIFL